MKYSLRSLLLAFVVIASALGTFGPWGLVIGLFIVAGVALSRAVRDTALQCVILLIIGGFIFAVLLSPAVPAAKEAARCAQCSNNLKQISLGLLHYEQQYGTFPPAYVPGPDGKPWHSWRVLILPFIEQQALYAAYNFNEPWRGPNNSKLSPSIPSIYVCPLSEAMRTRSGGTSYFAVVGPKTAWPGEKARGMNGISDGARNTILVMEANGLGGSWMEPRDLDFDQVTGQSKPAPKIIGTIPHPHPQDFVHVVEGGMFNVALADGRVRALPWGVSGETLAPLLTAQGGEKADADLAASTYSPRLNWPRILSLAVLVLSTLLLWRSTRPAPRGPPGAGQQARRTA